MPSRAAIPTLAGHCGGGAQGGDPAAPTPLAGEVASAAWQRQVPAVAAPAVAVPAVAVPARAMDSPMDRAPTTQPPRLGDAVVVAVPRWRPGVAVEDESTWTALPRGDGVAAEA